MARGLFAVMENENIGPVEAPQDERVVELEEQVAQGEVAEASQEVESAADTVDEAVAAIEELSEVADVMADATEGGEGLTEDAAEIAEVAVEAICARLGYKPSKKPIPSMEAFGSTSSRLDATKYAMEGIADTIRNIWNAIKGFFSRIWEGIKGLWARLFDANVKSKKRAESVAEKLKAAVNGKMVADNNKPVDVEKAMTAFGAMAAANPLALVSQIDSVLGNHTDAIAGQVKTNNAISELFDKAEKADSVDAISTVVQSIADDLTKDKRGYAYGYVVVVTTDEEKKTTSFELVDKSIKHGKINPVAPFKLKDLESVMEKVNQLQKAIDGAKSGVAKAEATVKKGIALADKLSKEENADPDVSKARTKAFQNGQAALVIINNKLPALGLRACGTALDFVAANLASYKAA